jgi:hypothetical protein
MEEKMMIKKSNNIYNMIYSIINKVSGDKSLKELIGWKLCALCLKMESHEPNSRYYFNIPTSEVLSFSEALGIDPDESGSFSAAGGGDYYRITMVLTCVGLSLSDVSIARNSYQLMLARTWNKMIEKSIPEGVDESIMDVVVKDRLTPQHMLTKRTLYNLIGHYYVVTILKKYGPDVKDCLVENADLLLSQGRTRLYHMFHGTSWSATDSVLQGYRDVQAEIRNKAT